MPVACRNMFTLWLTPPKTSWNKLCSRTIGLKLHLQPRESSWYFLVTSWNKGQICPPAPNHGNVRLLETMWTSTIVPRMYRTNLDAHDYTLTSSVISIRSHLRDAERGQPRPKIAIRTQWNMEPSPVPRKMSANGHRNTLLFLSELTDNTEKEGYPVYGARLMFVSRLHGWCTGYT